MLDEYDSAIGRHVCVVPAARHVRPHRDHHSAVADDYDILMGKARNQFVENGPDPISHMLIGLAAGWNPGPRPRMVVTFGLEDDSYGCRRTLRFPVRAALRESLIGQFNSSAMIAPVSRARMYGLVMTIRGFRSIK